MTKDIAILKRFGQRVKELRLKKGVTSQMALANKSNIDRSYIGGVERGQRNISLKNIEKIAKTLGVSLEELFRF